MPEIKEWWELDVIVKCNLSAGRTRTVLLLGSRRGFRSYQPPMKVRVFGRHNRRSRNGLESCAASFPIQVLKPECTKTRNPSSSWYTIARFIAGAGNRKGKSTSSGVNTQKRELLKRSTCPALCGSDPAISERSAVCFNSPPRCAGRHDSS